MFLSWKILRNYKVQTVFFEHAERTGAIRILSYTQEPCAPGAGHVTGGSGRPLVTELRLHKALQLHKY
jgi:hypothetical protein